MGLIERLRGRGFQARLRRALSAWVERGGAADPPFPGGVRHRSGGPGPVAAAIAHYEQVVLEGDWGVAWCYQGTFEQRPVFVLWVTTDGVDGWLETYDGAGQPLVQAKTDEGRGIRWCSKDEVRDDFDRWSPD